MPARRALPAVGLPLPAEFAPPGEVDPDDFAACDFDGDGDVGLADFAATPRSGEVAVDEKGTSPRANHS